MPTAKPRDAAAGTRRRKAAGAAGDRAATEALLMDAALRLIERDGVLAGLSLQEVADEAGVNRGLIHHYFGNRRSLVRAALDARTKAGAAMAEKLQSMGPWERADWRFAVHAGDDISYSRMLLLLALDGDTDIEPIPFAEGMLETLEREKAEGKWHEDADVLAALVVYNLFTYSYDALRHAVARQLGLSLRTLDGRVQDTIVRMYQALITEEPPPKRRRRAR